MTKTITAAEILERFDAGKTDFTDLGKCTVTGNLILGNRTVKTCVRLGKLTFAGFVRMSKSTFTYFDCDSATFNRFFDCCAATFEKDFQCGWATFEDDFCCDTATFNGVHAHRNPAVAWIIQQYKQSSVIYKLEHAPPWLQQQKPENVPDK